MTQIKKGYKQTDVGIIPEDWEVKRLGEIFNFLSTATYSRAQLGVEGEIQCLHYGDIHTKYENSVDFNKTSLPMILNQRTTKYTLLQDGDIVMADASEDYIGLCKSVSIKNIKEKKAISGLHTILLREKGSKFADGFKCFLFDIDFVRKQLIDLATGMKVFGVSKKNLEKVLLPIPTLDEQTSISTALSDTDALITSLDKLIAKKKLIKQGAMQELLTCKKRLPGFSGEWEEKMLGEICDVYSGGTPDTTNSTYYDGNIPFIKSGEIAQRFTEQNLSEEGLSSSASKLVNHGDILYALYGATSGECAISQLNGAINQAVLCIKSSENHEYLYNFLTFNKQNYIDKYIQGGQGNLSGEIVKSYIIKLPSLTEQIAIAQIFIDMDNEIVALESKRDKYRQLKSGMMQELLTGKIRLIEAVNLAQPAKIIEFKPKQLSHNEQINEAVVIGFLVHKFGTNDYPLSRYRYTKFAYLLHRQYEHVAKGFKKHAGGPYKSENRYKGPEKIAIKNRYIEKKENPKSGNDAFIVSDNIEKALAYFTKWYGAGIQQWIEQFRFYNNNYLEVLTTVDESICDLQPQNKPITVGGIKDYIRSIPKWKDKLKKPHFNDFNIQKAINESFKLFENN